MPEDKPEIRGLDKFPSRESEDVGESAVSGSVEIRGLDKFPNPQELEADESPPNQLTVGAKIIQRDSGKIYEVQSISDSEHGKRVHLVYYEDGEPKWKVTQDLFDLKTKLDTEDGPWTWA